MDHHDLVMFDFGMERATSSSTVAMRCGCWIQNIGGEIVMWGACGIEHNWIVFLGAQLRQVVDALSDIVRRSEGGAR